MTPRIWTPRVYQGRAFDFVMDTPKCGLFAGMGMGKSSTSLAVIAALNTIEGEEHTLVMAPKRVATMTWPNEIAEWVDFQHLSHAVITGTAAERRAAMRLDRNIHLVNYENIPWLLQELKNKWPWQRVIADESSKLKSHSALRFKGSTGRPQVIEDGEIVQKARAAMHGLKHVAHLTKRWVNLTGTPAPNGLQDLWSQVFLLDGGQRLGRTITAFRDRWFYSVPRPSGAGRDYIARPTAMDEILGLIQDICLTLRPEDYFDLPPLVHNPIWVDLPPDARAFYNTLEREFFAQFAGHNIEAVSGAALANKLLQCANGAVYYDDQRNWAHVHDAKLEALEDVLEEAAGAPVLIAYFFKHDLERLRRAHPDARVMDNNPQTLRDWNAGKIGKLLIHPDSAGHGLSMQHGGNILCFFSQTWKLESYQQVIERIGPTRQMQSGYDRPVFVHHLLARRTMDEVAVACGAHKANIQDAIKNYMVRS